MMEFVLQYGLFVAKTVTIVVAVGILAAIVAGLSPLGVKRRGIPHERLNSIPSCLISFRLPTIE